jgi:hypothetical protein
MRKKPDYNDLARKWPLPIRKGIKFPLQLLRRLIVIIEGDTKITPKMLEQMAQTGLIFEKMSSFIHIPEFLKDEVDSQDEDVLSSFIMTAITFRDCQSPSLENYGKSDRQTLKKMKPRRTETEHASIGLCSQD